MCDPGLTEMSMALLPPDAERWVGWATSQKGLTNPAGKIYKDWKLGKSPPKPRKCKNGDDSRRFLGVGTEFEAIIEH